MIQSWYVAFISGELNVKFPCAKHSWFCEAYISWPTPPSSRKFSESGTGRWSSRVSLPHTVYTKMRDVTGSLGPGRGRDAGGASGDAPPASRPRPVRDARARGSSPGDVWSGDPRAKCGHFVYKIFRRGSAGRGRINYSWGRNPEDGRVHYRDKLLVASLPGWLPGCTARESWPSRVLDPDCTHAVHNPSPPPPTITTTSHNTAQSSQPFICIVYCFVWL